jgi:hypothetical protein
MLTWQQGRKVNMLFILKRCHSARARRNDGRRKQREILDRAWFAQMAAKTLDRPERRAPVKINRPKGVSMREAFDRPHADMSPEIKIANAAEPVPTRFDKLARRFLAKALDLTEAQPQRIPAPAIIAVDSFKTMVPQAVIDIDRADLAIMVAKIAYNAGC